MPLNLKGDASVLHPSNSVMGYDASKQDAATKTAAQRTKKIDKHSLDYVIRSGIAGGLAGCAVRILYAAIYHFID
jgi:hypothetical protein